VRKTDLKALQQYRAKIETNDDMSHF